MTSSYNIRNRNKKQTSDDDDSRTSRKKSLTAVKGTPKGLKLSFICLIISVLILVIVFGFYMDHILLSFGFHEQQFAVIIDAGSTGSRVLCYKFHKNFPNGKLVLDDELFRERKPGLSSFADNPSKGAHSIKLLLNEAKKFVPEKKWRDTPLVLKATAGLRLLPTKKAEDLLASVRSLFAKSEFNIDKSAVEIMDGTDEGIFSWFTVNFLLKRLSHSTQAAALDLGGGSTQVTFSTSDPQQVPRYEKYIHTVHTLNKDVNVFTNSYLGLGLMAGRHATFTKGYKPSDIFLESECVNPIVKNRTFIYSNVEYFVSGKPNQQSTEENPYVNFDNCLNSVKSMVIPLVRPKPLTLKQNTIAAFSYYFDRAIESGLIDPFEGGEISVKDYRQKAKDVCATANTDQPFMCFDLTFISTLLMEGFGLSETKKVKLYKRIDNHEISWALGCAYNILTSDNRFN